MAGVARAKPHLTRLRTFLIESAANEGFVRKSRNSCAARGRGGDGALVGVCESADVGTHLGEAFGQKERMVRGGSSGRIR